MSRIMEKGKLAIFGQQFPGIIATEPVPAIATTTAGRSFPTYRADVITLRGTNPANGPVTYSLRKTNEDLGFWFARTKHVIGVDVTAEGDLIELEELSDMALADTLAFQALNLGTRAAAEIELDAEADLDDPHMAAIAGDKPAGDQLPA